MATKNSTGAPKRADHVGTAPLPAPAAEALARREAAFPSPVERLRKQVARLEESLRIQCEARDADLATMRDMSLPEAKRAEAEGSFQSAAWEVIWLQGQLREYKAELSAALGYATASARAAQLNERVDGGVKLSALEWDDLAHAEDVMSGTKATLAKAGRLDLIGGAV